MTEGAAAETGPAETSPAVPAGRPPPEVALEAEVAPESAARLFRLPCLAGLSAGRSVAERLLWLDGADGPLAARGMVAERPPRGPGRVVALTPGWAGVVVPDGDELPGPLLPFAGWEGRRRDGVRATPEGAVTVTLRTGRIRAAAAEAEAARVLVRGPADAVLGLLHVLAEEAGATPPGASLAGGARALSRGEPVAVPPPARRDSLPADLDTLAVSALRDAAASLMHHGPLVREDADAVRRMRVAVRRVRAVLKALQPRTACPEITALDEAAAALGRALGAARDWDVFLGGAASRVAKALGDPDARLAALVRRAEARRAEDHAALREEIAGPRFRQFLWSLLVAAEARPWGDGSPPPTLPQHGAGLLTRRWSKLKRQGEVLDDGDADAVHRLRLAGKRLRYAASAFAPLWPGRDARRFLSRLEALQDALGQANDASVARTLAAGLAGRDPRRVWAAGLIEGWSLAEERRARKQARRAWKRLRKADPFWEAPPA